MGGETPERERVSKSAAGEHWTHQKPDISEHTEQILLQQQDRSLLTGLLIYILAGTSHPAQIWANTRGCHLQ